MWKKFIKDYLTFTRKDRRGIIILLSLIVSVLVIPAFFPYFKKEQVINQDEVLEKVRQLNSITRDSFVQAAYTSETVTAGNKVEKAELFYFDPNEISITEWKKLGLSDKTARTILNYISKGGKFDNPEDLIKIYSLSQKDADRLIPFVRIRTSTDRPDQASNERKKDVGTGYSYKEKKYAPIDINTADTTAYISLPGIGSKLAQRIVNFRDKLGGFTSIDQVGETYFLPDSVFQKIKPLLLISDTRLKKININKATKDELRAHPYIKYNIANVIVQYRNQHGAFSDVNELKKINIIDDELYNKIHPYLSVQ